MQGRTAAQSGASPWLRSPNSVAGSYMSSQPSTPGTVYSNNSVALSMGSRTKRLARKLSFWKKSETSAADVRDSLRGLQKSHRKYHAATRLALDRLREWSSQLAAPPKYPSEWQARLADPDLQDLLLSVYSAIYPLHARDGDVTQMLGDFASGFRSLSYYEETCKRVAAEAAAADRAYYKERRRCTRMIEAKGGEAELKADGELTVYDNKRRGLRSQLESVGAQYCRQCETELPRQFGPVLEHAKQTEEAVRVATVDLMTARVNHPPANYGEALGSPKYRRYTPGLAASAFTAHRQQFTSSPIAREVAPSPESGCYTPEFNAVDYKLGLATQQYKRNPITGQYTLMAASDPYIAGSVAQYESVSPEDARASSSGGLQHGSGSEDASSALGTPPVPLDTGPWGLEYAG